MCGARVSTAHLSISGKQRQKIGAICQKIEIGILVGRKLGLIGRAVPYLKGIQRPGEDRLGTVLHDLWGKADLLAPLGRQNDPAVVIDFYQLRKRDEVALKKPPFTCASRHLTDARLKPLHARNGVAFDKGAIGAAINHDKLRAPALAGWVTGLQHTAKGRRDGYPRLCVNLLVELASECLRHDPLSPPGQISRHTPHLRATKRKLPTRMKRRTERLPLLDPPTVPSLGRPGLRVPPGGDVCSPARRSSLGWFVGPV